MNTCSETSQSNSRIFTQKKILDVDAVECYLHLFPFTNPGPWKQPIPLPEQSLKTGQQPVAWCPQIMLGLHCLASGSLPCASKMRPLWIKAPMERRWFRQTSWSRLWESVTVVQLQSLMNQQHSYQCHSDFYSLATSYTGPSANHINPVSKHARCRYRASWDMFHSVDCDKPSHNTLPVLPGKRGTRNNICLLACHQREITVSK